MYFSITNAAIALAALAGAPDTPRGSGAPPNPACALLTTAEIREATGTSYDDGDEGDALGEGAGGGASCQWGGPSFVPGKEQPLLSLVVIPPGKGGSYTEARLKTKPLEGCTREKVGDIGDLAFVDSCPKSRGPVAFVKAGEYDLIVQMDAKPPATAASVKPKVLAVARAGAAKVR